MSRRMRKRAGGQVLALFALGLLVFLGAAALTIDYGYWLQERRNLQNAADAAAQSGVSELLERPITPAKQDAATEHAMLYLDDQLRMGLEANGQINCAAAAASDPTGNGFGPEDGCGPYAGPDRVFIRTPVSAGMGCKGTSWGNRAITVGVRHASDRFFSRIYSVGNPDVSVCATSAIYGGSLAIAVLKPNSGDQPNSSNLTMKLAGSDTFIRVYGGDVAINAAFSAAGAPPPTSPNEPAYIKFMTASGTGISDNRMFATLENPSPLPWSVVAKQIRTEGLTTLEDDDVYHEPWHLPAYVPIPGWGNARYQALLASESSLPGPVELAVNVGDPGNSTDPGCVSPIPGAARIAPGRYSLLDVANSAQVWLCPGVHHFFAKSGAKKGLQTGQNAIVAGQGVTLVFESDSSLKLDSGAALLLNCETSGKAACSGSTPAPWTTDDVRHNVPITIWIEPVPGCDPLQAACSDSTSTDVFTMGSQAGMDVRGIIFGPTDKMKIAGNGDHHGSGEIWAWTLEYLGNSILDQIYEGSDDGWPLLVE